MERDVFMEQRYRGYPQALIMNAEQIYERPMEAQNAAAQPYMIYNREEKTPETDAWDDRWRMRAESDYFRGLYPLEAKRLRRVAETEFDRIDQDGGPMYDEYPDREFIYRLRDRMLAQALAEGIAADRDLMQVIMLHELLRRRAFRR